MFVSLSYFSVCFLIWKKSTDFSILAYTSRKKEQNELLHV